MLRKSGNRWPRVFVDGLRSGRGAVALGAIVLVAVSSLTRAQGQARAMMVGLVIDSADARPIEGVSVSLGQPQFVKVTDARGEFRLTEIPPGQHLLQLRKLGYRAVDIRVSLSAGDTLERRFILGRAVTTLDSVVVTAQSSGIASFDERRRLGLGHFFGRVDLEKQGERRMGDVLAGVPGLGLVNGRSGQRYVYSKRMTGSMCPPVRITNDEAQPGCLAGQGIYVPSKVEAAQGIQIACYAQVYVDDVLMNRTRPTEPFNLNEFRADQIEAIEYYAGASQTPAKYSVLDSRCGVVVLWTRRGRH